MKARKLLESSGFRVIRSAGSKGPFDLIAVSDNLVIFIQVKSEAYIPKAEKDELKAFPIPPWARKEVWWWKKEDRSFGRVIV